MLTPTNHQTTFNYFDVEIISYYIFFNVIFFFVIVPYNDLLLTCIVEDNIMKYLKH